MKLKKYKQFILLKEEKEELVNVDGVKFYHGTILENKYLLKSVFVCCVFLFDLLIK